MKNMIWFLFMLLIINDLSAQKWTSFTTTDGLANNVVNSIAFDAKGNKWFATNGGLSMFTDSTWTNYNSSNGLKTDIINTIAIDKNDKKWFNNCNGWMSFDNSNFSYTKIKGNGDNCFSSAPVNVIHVDLDNNVWIGMSTNIDGFTIYGKGVYSGSIDKWVQSIASDKNMNVWFGYNGDAVGGGGVCVYYGGDKTKAAYFNLYNSANKLISNDIEAIAIDAENNKWFGTYAKGLQKFDGTDWTTYTTADGLVSNYIRAIAIDSQDNKWIATSSGVSKFDGTNWTTYNTTNGLIT